ncbi:hypothetical protein [Desertivirga brevis]|uniref:hypothetical protein n=1 Tax=Desertivirga brevis TaxID=2810310 RepID=UPI001A95D6E5|nr:hypothetical protein [Pedobacter sp. SYSU D00873]
MKIYQCDEELAAVFEGLGFMETTKPFDKLRNKREFRRSKTSPLVILFDRGNLMAFEHHQGCDIPDRPTSKELQLFIWYINSNSIDRDAISPGSFNIQKAKENYNMMLSMTEEAEELEVRTPQIRKFRRILTNYSSIALS